ASSFHFGFLCFFFQAEDGIRDLIVTGVQTCALPIWLESPAPMVNSNTSGCTCSKSCVRVARSIIAGCAACHVPSLIPYFGSWQRSEERRVGKSVDLGGGRSRRKTRETCYVSPDGSGK